ncbi:uncharacterized protein [Dysidea avara]|uniref:uncharacterized protein isoform X2 n=1 Tax=Dysidea avara TaxID=196820 RepID=UPI0033304E9D
MDHVKVQSSAYDDYSSCPSKVTRGCLGQESQRVCSVEKATNRIVKVWLGETSPLIVVMSQTEDLLGEIDAIIRRRIAYSVSSTIRVLKKIEKYIIIQYCYCHCTV